MVTSGFRGSSVVRGPLNLAKAEASLRFASLTIGSSLAPSQCKNLLGERICYQGHYSKPGRQGDDGLAGEAVDLIAEVASAGELVRSIGIEAESNLRHANKFLQVPAIRLATTLFLPQPLSLERRNSYALHNTTPKPFKVTACVVGSSRMARSHEFFALSAIALFK
jgi:hypothetical protein